MLKIEITSSGLEAELALKTLASRFTEAGRKRLCNRLAASLERTFKKKFNENGASPKPGKSSWPTTGFWQRAGDSIETAASPEGASLRVKQIGVSLQFRGGTVRPTSAKNLAIPVSPAVYGRRPKGFSKKEFFFFKSKAGHKFLARRKGESVELCYLLKPSATVRPHPEKFPSDSKILTDAEQTVLNHIAIERL